MDELIKIITGLFSSGKITGDTSSVGEKKLNSEKNEWTYPSFSGVLPYRYFDDETDIFINKNTIGFVLEATPLIGANEQVVQALDDLIRKKLPRKTPLAIIMVGSKCVGEIIDNGLDKNIWRGPMADKLNAITRAYYGRAALKGFENKREYPLYLRNYRVFIIYGKKVNTLAGTALQELNQLRHTLKVSFEAAKVDTKPVAINEFLSVIRELTNYRPTQTNAYSSDYNQHEEINRQCVDLGYELHVEPNHLKLRLNHELGNASGEQEKTRIIHLQLTKNPRRFALWQTPDNYQNVCYQEMGIPCPFVVTWCVEVEDQVSSQSEALKKDMDLSKKAKSAYASLFPGTETAAQEWKKLRQELSTGETSLARYYYNVTLFCPDDNGEALKCELAAINAFRKNDLDISAPHYQQLRNHLAMYPFFMQEGLWDDIKNTGSTLRCKSFNAVNLAPVVADNPMCSSGLLLPTYRNQIAFYDPFGEIGNTNYNVAVTGTSGAGKTFLIQSVLRQVINSGGYAWVIDMGDGYKNYCNQVGGVYLDGQNLRFNPFANIQDINKSVEGVCSLLTVLASPKDMLDEVSESILQSAVVDAWMAKKNKARIDDVYNFLTELRSSGKHSDAPNIIARISELCELLEKYCTWGTFGEYFNSDNPSLTDDTKFAVLELLGLEKQPKLMAAILFSLILAIQEKMFHTDRNLKKLCIIDEGWRLLSGSNEHAAKFIETGYRTVRRHTGGFITITQHMKDFVATKEAQAAWNNSATKITLLQDKSSFQTYLDENPNQFTPLEQEVIKKFQKAQDTHFSSVMISVGGNTSFHRLFVDPITRAMCSSHGEHFSFMQEQQRNGATSDEAAYVLAKRIYRDELTELEGMIGETKY